MDGVLAKWENVSLEETFLPGYFLSRQPEPSVIEAVKNMYEMGIDISILSCAYDNGIAGPEKAKWLELNGLGMIPRIFVPYGKDKSDFIEEADVNVLLDDYSRNLPEWKAKGNLGFKFYNGINGTHGTWSGYSVNYRMSAKEIMIALTSIGRAYAKTA